MWDFGLNNFVKCSSMLTHRALEVINGLKSSKAINFGSVLLELLSGKPPPHLLNPDVDLQDFVHSVIIDAWPRENEDISKKIIKLFQIVFICASLDAKDRLQMADVVQMIQHRLQP
ncbi:probable inactive receptor kinase [Tanacetum coccineum]